MPLLRGPAARSGVLVVLLLAGCTGQDAAPVTSPAPAVSGTAAPEPSPTPTPTPTPTPVATPGPVAAPEPPAELERTDEVGAAAAAEYFVALYEYTMRTGDVERWSAMSSEICGFCARIADDANEMARNNEHYSGGGITLADIRVRAKDDLIGGYPVDATFHQAPVRHIASDGSLLNSTDGDSGPVRVDTLHEDGAWKILAVVVGERS